jgi:hypothetical protein
MSRAILVRLLAPGLAILALSACSGGASSDAVGPSGTAAQGETSLQTQQACRQRVNETFEKQNRPEIYAANSSLNSPFSANFQPNVASRGLAGQFSYERSVTDCEHNAATGPDVETVAPPTAAKGR